MSNINLNLYRIFCAVASSKSYSEASEKINQTVPNISKHITMKNVIKTINTK